MESRSKRNSGNAYYELIFMSAFRQVFQNMRQAERDIVCMKCRRYVSVGGALSECCEKFGFFVDPKSVVIDKATGKVTQASPSIDSKDTSNYA